MNYKKGFYRLLLVLAVPAGLLMVGSAIYRSAMGWGALIRLAVENWIYTLAIFVIIAALVWVAQGFVEPSDR
jgi:hypothetical protein